jgi:nucleoside-diphosphate-sugar epimerase
MHRSSSPAPGGFVGTACCRSWTRWDAGIGSANATRSGRETECRTVGDLATATDDALARALDSADAVVHLAGRAHVTRDRSVNSANAHREANVVASERLARAAVRAGIARFVFVSTIKVNGETTSPGRPFRESDPPHPEDAYARSKWEAEQRLREIADASGLTLTILRPPLMYGPRVRGNFLALWRAVARGAPLPFGRVDNRRSVLYVGNLVHAIVELLDARRRRRDKRGSSPTKKRVDARACPSHCRRVGEAGAARSIARRRSRCRHRRASAAGARAAIGGIARDRRIGACGADRTTAVFARRGTREDGGVVADPAAMTLRRESA